MNKYPVKFNLQDNSIIEYQTSDFLKELKQQIGTGEWPSGCIRCQIEEENGIESKRILDYVRWQDAYKLYNLEKSEILTASIAFGNTCNLTCITCNSGSSSRWHKEYKDIYNIDIPHFKFYKENFVEDFIRLSPNLIHLDIPGGEPFLSGIAEQHKLLQYYIDNNQAKEITLHYTTNATIFPDDHWWQLWKHFKEVDLQISIDGVEEQYEYIRYPGKWSVLVNNVSEYLKRQKNNIRLSVSHTVSAYNIYYLDKFFKWCESIGLPKPWLGRVHYPYHMQPNVWGSQAKTDIYNKLISSNYTDVRNWANLILNTDNSEYFDQFCKLTAQHDAYRNLDFFKTFPEMAIHLK